jgi:iron complex outermembrane receptor protein
MKQFQRHTLAGAILAAAATTQAQTMLEEVTVTAQKRSENVMDVPIAISVFNNNALEQLSARNLTDLGRFTSGVEMNNMNSLQPTYTIRGIQTNDWTVGSDPAVAVYVDGVYAARGAGAEAALADIARIEVLKGPQGTLFGRNATGGAIHIISHAPVHERQGRARLTLGDYNRFDGEVMFNTPLSDTLAVRLMAVNRNRDGYLENLTGPDMGEQGTENYRASVLWDAGHRSTVAGRVQRSGSECRRSLHGHRQHLRRRQRGTATGPLRRHRQRLRKP